MNASSPKGWEVAETSVEEGMDIRPLCEVGSCLKEATRTEVAWQNNCQTNFCDECAEKNLKGE